MKTNVILCALALSAFGVQASAQSHDHANGASARANTTVSAAPSAFFDSLKETMTGNWQGRYTDGTFEAPTDWKPVRVEYRLTSNGTALVEDYLFGDTAAIGMTTVYHQDNNDLRLTHYCGAANHPSMIATSIDTATGRVLFDFTDITNLSKSDDYHSRQMEVTIVDEDHIRILYHGLQRGKIESQAYDLRRAGS